MKKYLLSACIALCMGATIALPSRVSAQPAPTVPGDGAFVPPPGWNDIMVLIKDAKTRPAGVQKLYELAAQNPRTRLAAHCLATAVLYDPDANKARQTYESFIRDYPGTSIEVAGRTGLLNLRWFSGEARGTVYLAGAEDILRAVKAPTLEEIRANRGRASTRFRALPAEIQGGLLSLYRTVHQIQSGSLKRYRDDLPLALFLLEVYPNGNFMGAVTNDIGELRGDPGPYDAVWVNPVVTVRQPREGKNTGLRPLISLETYTGDYTHAQPDLSGSKILLDGQDIKSSFIVRIKFAKQKRAGLTLQTIRLKYRPIQPLSPGPHKLDVTIQTTNYNPSRPGLTHVITNFTVARDCRDEDDDDDERWGEIED